MCDLEIWRSIFRSSDLTSEHRSPAHELATSPDSPWHPHPALPSAFASASSTQQASTPAGAGPPQQSAAAAVRGVDFTINGTATAGITGDVPQQLMSRARSVLQTPVSG